MVIGIVTVTTALLTTCPTIAKGDSLIYTFEPSQFDLGANSEMSGLQSVPQFNPALGVLDSIDISFDSGYASTVAFSGPSGVSGHFDLYEQTTFQDSGNNIDVSIGNAWTCYFSTSAGTSSGSSSPGSAFFSYNSPAVLSEFTGDGNFSFQVTGSQHADTTFAPPGVTANITDGNFGADATVTYIYTVPEPGSASLLVVGLGLTLAWRTAKKRESLKR